MDRVLMRDLAAWKNSPQRKPLLLDGPRRVGKTSLVKEFGRRYFRHTAYVDLAESPGMRQVFEEDYDIRRVLLSINAETGAEITPDTLIILDEIQEAPKVISALKSFQEYTPRYPVIASGTLSGTVFRQSLSYPVGKIDRLRLHPLSFYEFLNATGDEGLAKLLDAGDWPLISAFRDRFEFALKNYFFVGRIPECVKVFTETRDYGKVRSTQRGVLSLYEEDFGKRFKGKEADTARLIWRSIPGQLAKKNKKFVFSEARKHSRAADFESVCHTLSESGVMTRVPRVSKPSLPLSAFEEPHAYKLFLPDVGLLNAASSIDARVILEENRLFRELLGGLTQQYVCQQLISESSYKPRFYLSENGRYAMDFMIHAGNEVFPIEVTADVNPKSKRLRAYFDQYHPAKAIRFSLADYRDDGWRINIPLFAMHTALTHKAPGFSPRAQAPDPGAKL